MIGQSTSPIQWDYWLKVYLDDNHQYPSDLDSQVVVGKAVLSDSPNFVVKWLDFVAEQSGRFVRYTDILDQQVSTEFLRPSAGLHSANPDAYKQLKARQMILNAASTSSGYMALVDYVAGGSLRAFLDTSQPIFFDERKRAKHSFCSGSSGSGKSEFLKAIIYDSIIRRPKDAIVIIDPHGELAIQVAKFPEVALSGRLALIDPNLFAGFTPIFNPLSVPADPLTMELFLNQLFQSVVTVLSEGNEFSDTMSALLKPIHQVFIVEEVGFVS